MIATLIDALYSWRFSFITIGGTGIVFGLIGMTFIKEPRRGNFDVNVGDKPVITGSGLIRNYMTAFVEIFKNRTSLWIIIGGCFRFWSGNVISYYTGKYFNIYPEYVVSYININNNIDLILSIKCISTDNWWDIIQSNLWVYLR